LSFIPDLLHYTIFTLKVFHFIHATNRLDNAVRRVLSLAPLKNKQIHEAPFLYCRSRSLVITSQLSTSMVTDVQRDTNIKLLLNDELYSYHSSSLADRGGIHACGLWKRTADVWSGERLQHALH